jgi:uncharacterized membrane protein
MTMVSWTLLLFRLVHIVGGVFWVGTVLFLAGFLFPTVRAVGPAGGPVMQQLTQHQRLPLYLMGAAILTVLSGLGLYWHDSAGFRSAWLGTRPAMIYGIGAVLAIVAVGLGMAINAPTARRLGALSETIRAGGMPPSADQAAALQDMQRRLDSATRLAAVLLVLATIAMAVARYVP